MKTMIAAMMTMMMMVIIGGNERSRQFASTARKRGDTISTAKDVRVSVKRFRETSKFNQWRTFVSHLRKSVKSQ